MPELFPIRNFHFTDQKLQPETLLHTRYNRVDKFQKVAKNQCGSRRSSVEFVTANRGINMFYQMPFTMLFNISVLLLVIAPPECDLAKRTSRTPGSPIQFDPCVCARFGRLGAFASGGNWSGRAECSGDIPSARLRWSRGDSALVFAGK